MTEALAWWARFVHFIEGHLRAWGVVRWTATLETNKDGKHHGHAMLEFSKRVCRTARYYAFAGTCPNARANDLLGEAWCGRRWCASVDREHFYVWANKKGMVRGTACRLCVAGNYEPAWTGACETYEVRAEWPEKLWRAYKLEDAVYYNAYLFLCKDKVAAKKRISDTYRAWRRG